MYTLCKQKSELIIENKQLHFLA